MSLPNNSKEQLLWISERLTDIAEVRKGGADTLIVQELLDVALQCCMWADEKGKEKELTKPGFCGVPGCNCNGNGRRQALLAAEERQCIAEELDRLHPNTPESFGGSDR